jgi:hypothetical protein
VRRTSRTEADEPVPAILRPKYRTGTAQRAESDRDVVSRRVRDVAADDDHALAPQSRAGTVHSLSKVAAPLWKAPDTGCQA